MRIVVTHHNADLDALASLVAACKLHPGAIGVRGRSVSIAVRRYLALHKDRFPLQWYHEVLPDGVEEMIIVDVRDRRRLSEYEKFFERSPRIVVYDHHPVSEYDVDADECLVEPVGACITLLCEKLREKQIVIEPDEATLMLLGLYADTGQLSYASTTPRDVDCAAFLLRQGGNLAVVQRYLQQQFSHEQRRLFMTLMAGLSEESIDGVSIGLACATTDKYVGGASDVVERVMQLGNYDAMFGIVEFSEKQRVQIVARSHVLYVDVGNVLRSLGGGGHQGAAAVMLKEQTVEQAYQNVLNVLRAEPLKPTRVRELMSSPVQTVDHRTTLERARELMNHWNISGVPVMREGKVCGIISRRDIARASEADNLNLPVSAFMAHNVQFVTPDFSLEDALEKMTEHDIGRLPVFDDQERLVAIVSRTDILKCLYQ